MPPTMKNTRTYTYHPASGLLEVAISRANELVGLEIWRQKAPTPRLGPHHSGQWAQRERQLQEAQHRRPRRKRKRHFGIRGCGVILPAPKPRARGALRGLSTSETAIAVLKLCPGDPCVRARHAAAATCAKTQQQRLQRRPPRAPPLPACTGGSGGAWSRVWGCVGAQKVARGGARRLWRCSEAGGPPTSAARPARPAAL